MEASGTADAAVGALPVRPDRPDWIDRIDVARLDFGVGVLRGALSVVQPLRDKPEQVELAIEHIRAAARLIEKLQREKARDRYQKRRAARSGVRRSVRGT